MTASAVSCLILLFIVHSGSGTGWHYGEEDLWPKLCKEGRKQSPIALTKSIAEEMEFSAFILDKYSENYPVQTKNNGHSAEIRLNVQEQPSVRGGGLPAVYVLDHLHFHWESEHTVDNYRFPLELHLVHYARTYKNLSQALQYRDGVAVFAVLYDLSPDDDVEFDPLIAVIDKLHEKNDQVVQLRLKVSDYLPRDTAGYYRYNGSLTTPECTEGVIWTVFTNTVPISKSQVDSFHLLQTEEKDTLVKNYRPLQHRNGRIVYHKVSPIRASGASQNKVHLRYERLFIFVVMLYNAFRLI